MPSSHLRKTSDAGFDRARSHSTARRMQLRRPFWLPASSYYALALSVSAALFFLLWGLLHDGWEEMPWVGAGISASALMIAAVLLRELVLRRARERYYEKLRMLESSLRPFPLKTEGNSVREKLSLEQNAQLLNSIQQKSEAAKVLGRHSSGHREVFELCEHYLRTVRLELNTVAPGSPRIAAFRKGIETVGRIHKSHVLFWAEIESRHHAQTAKRSERAADQVESLSKAIAAVDQALESYPEESALLESRAVLVDLADSVRVSDFLSRADRASEKGNHKRALKLMLDAERILKKDASSPDPPGFEMLEQKISDKRRELERSAKTNDRL